MRSSDASAAFRTGLVNQRAAHTRTQLAVLARKHAKTSVLRAARDAPRLILARCDTQPREGGDDGAALGLSQVRS